MLILLLALFPIIAIHGCEVTSQEGAICRDIKSDVAEINKLSGNITMLTLYGAQGPITSDTLKKFDNLTELVIRDGNITSIENGCLCSSKKLTKINFISSTLPAIKKGIFDDCGGVEKMYFAFVPDFKVDLDGFAGLDNVHDFIFDHGNWSHLEKGQMSGLSNVESLVITNSHVQKIDVGFFEPLRHLQKLSLTGNAIEVLEKGTLTNQTELEEIQLFGNKLKQITGTEFENLDSLVILDVIMNPITEVDVDTLVARLPSLRHFYITRSFIPDDKRRDIAKKLKEAGLSRLDY